MKSVGIQLRVGDILFAVQKRWKIILSLTFLGLVFGLLMSAMSYLETTADTYRIDGSVMISAADPTGHYPNNGITPNKADITMAEDLYDTVNYIVFSDRLLDEVINDTELLGVSTGALKSSISLSRYGESSIVTIRLVWDNGDEGLLIWQDIVDKTNALLRELINIGELRVINAPRSSVYSSRSSAAKTWMALPVLGFAAGLGFSVIELLMRPTLINPKDVETVFGLETLGIIPLDNAFFHKKTSILVKDDNVSTNVIQNYSSAAYILVNRLGARDHCQCLYVTSADSQEGRTTAAANLAIQMSDMEHKTLLIDFDYKNPTLGTLFLNTVDYNHSLNALYRGEIAPEEAITNLTGYLDLLPMVMEYSLITMDSAVIDLITRLKQQYEYIIIDAPPVGKESETLSLNKVASTVLFVAGYDMSSMNEIQSSLEKLDKSGTRIVGCIINKMQSSKNLLRGESAQSDEANRKNRRGKGKKKKKEKGENKEVTESLNALTAQEKSKKENENKKKKKKGLFKRRSKKDENGNSEQSTPNENRETEAPAKVKKKKRKEKPPFVLRESREKSAGKVSADDYFGDVKLSEKQDNKRHNIYMDLMGEVEEIEAPRQTDAEVVQELLKIGLEGNWGSNEESDTTAPVPLETEQQTVDSASSSDFLSEMSSGGDDSAAWEEPISEMAEAAISRETPTDSEEAEDWEHPREKADEAMKAEAPVEIPEAWATAETQEDQNLEEPSELPLESGEADVVYGIGVEAAEDENPEAAEDKNPEIAEVENPEALEDENPEIAEDDSPEIAEDENPEAAEDENPEIAEVENPEALEDDSPEAAEDENPEIAEGDNPEAAEVENPEAPEDENPEIAEDENPEALEDDSPEIAEDENPEIAEDDNPEIAEDENPEGTEDDNPEIAEDENPEIAEDENPEAAEDDNPEALEDENPEGTEDENPEIAEDENPEIAEDENPEALEDDSPEALEDDSPEALEDDSPEALEDENPEIAEDENPEGAEDENPEIAEVENPEIAEVENPEIAEDENPEAAEVENPETAEDENPEAAEVFVDDETIVESPKEHEACSAPTDDIVTESLESLPSMRAAEANASCDVPDAEAEDDAPLEIGLTSTVKTAGTDGREDSLPQLAESDRREQPKSGVRRIMRSAQKNREDEDSDDDNIFNSL